jgi:uncharacterized protein
MLDHRIVDLDGSEPAGDPDRAACQLIEKPTFDGEEKVFFIAGFYEFRDGRIASAKIYREGSADLA